VRIPDDFEPGVMLLHRQSLKNPDLRAHMERLAARGWVLVLDFDDSPWLWQDLVDSDFFAFRFAHAVSVSSEPLAGMVRQWNPTVEVLPNAVAYLPRPPVAVPKDPAVIRVFFGALNRSEDWAAVAEGIGQAADELGDRVEFVIVHDRAVHDALPTAAKSFHPMLPPDRYMAVLAACDVALLPLIDRHSSRMKSDLKLIECCAAGVVPICSPVVYDARPEHREVALFATAPAEWRDALLRLCTDPGELASRRAAGLAYVTRRRMHAQAIAPRLRWYRDLRDRRDALDILRRQRLAAIVTRP
jgi:hypothetical protein